jgi:hypothetical protein
MTEKLQEISRDDADEQPMQKQEDDYEDSTTLRQFDPFPN